MSPSKVLNSYGAVVAVALLLGLLTGGFPVYPAEITVLALAIMMTFSMSEVAISRRAFRGMLHLTSAAVALNYLLLTSLIITISLFFEGDIRSGWLLMAAVPSAVAVVPFSYMIGGNTRLALSGTTTIYLLSLAVAPLIAVVGIGQEIDRLRLLYTIILLILLPMGVSRLGWLRSLRRETKTPLINLCFGILVFAMTGANRGAFAEEHTLVIWVALASLIRTFGIGSLLYLLLRRTTLPPDKVKVLVLFSSYKNLGLTAAIAMALIGSDAAIPPTICIPFEILWLIVLKRDPFRRTRKLTDIAT